MSVGFAGVFSRSAGIISAVAKQLKSVTFKPVAKITVQFDPFEERVKHARDLLHWISAPKIQKTNLACILKTKVVCDRSEPTVTCDLISGKKFIFKLGCLDSLEFLKLYNKHISSLVPVEEPVEVGRQKKKRKLRLKKKIPRSRR